MKNIMKLITKTKLVSGGNPAIAAGAAVITGVAAMGTAIQTFNGWGHNLGEWYYNHRHGGDMGLGPMNYQAIPNSYYYHAW